MASIRKRVGKYGDLSFCIRVFMGNDTGNKQIVKSMTYRAPSDLTESEAEIEAKRQAIMFENECRYHSGKDIQIEFEVLAKEYLSFMSDTQKLKPSTLKFLKSISNRVCNNIGDMYINEITQEQIQRFINSLSEDVTSQRTGKALSHNSIRQHITFINGVLSYAVDCSIITENPCKNVKVFEARPKREHYSMDELNLLLAIINAEAKGANVKAILSLLGYNGMNIEKGISVSTNNTYSENTMKEIKTFSEDEIKFEDFFYTLTGEKIMEDIIC